MKKENGYIEWFEFSPQSNLLMIKVGKLDETKLTTDTGIIIATKANNVGDRPYYGEIVSIGPDVKENVEIGNIVYFPSQNAYDMGMIKTLEDGSTFLLTTSDRIDGIKVKDTRK